MATSFTSFEGQKTARDLFMALAKVDGREQMDNLFTRHNIRNYQDNGGKENFYDVIMADIQANVDILKVLTKHFLSNPEARALAGGKMLLEGGNNVAVNFKWGTATVTTANYMNIIIENLYYDMLDVLPEELKEELKEAYPDAQSFRVTLKGMEAVEKKNEEESEEIREFDTLIKSSSLPQFEKYFSAYVSRTVSIKIDETREYFERAAAITTANAFADKKDSMLYPMDEIDNKYEKHPSLVEKISTINSLLKGSIVAKIEMDISDSKTLLDKENSLNYLIETIQAINESNFPFAEQFVFRIRKLQRHSEAGMMVLGINKPGTKDELAQVVVEAGQNGATAVIHQLALLVDQKTLHELQIAKDMANYFSSKLDLKGYSQRYRSMLREPNQIRARLCELGYFLHGKNAGEISLVKSFASYSSEPGKYFDFTNWSDEEEEMVKSFYSLYFDGQMTQQQKEDIEASLNEKLKNGLENIYVENEEKAKKQSYRRVTTEDENRIQRLRQSLKKMNVPGANIILKTLSSLEENRLNAPFTANEFVEKIMDYMEKGYLSPKNTKTQANAGGQTLTIRTRFNKNLLIAFAKTIVELPKEQRKEILSNQGVLSKFDHPMYTIEQLRGDQYNIKEWSHYNRHKATAKLGFFYFMTNEEIKEYVFNEPEEFAEVYSSMLAYSVKLRKQEHIANMLKQVMGRKKVEFTNEELSSLILENFDSRKEFMKAFGRSSYYIAYMDDAIRDKNKKDVPSVEIPNDLSGVLSALKTKMSISDLDAYLSYDLAMRNDLHLPKDGDLSDKIEVMVEMYGDNQVVLSDLKRKLREQTPAIKEESSNTFTIENYADYIVEKNNANTADSDFKKEGFLEQEMEVYIPNIIADSLSQVFKVDGLEIPKDLVPNLVKAINLGQVGIIKDVLNEETKEELKKKRVYTIKKKLPQLKSEIQNNRFRTDISALLYKEVGVDVKEGDVPELDALLGVLEKIASMREKVDLLDKFNKEIERLKSLGRDTEIKTIFEEYEDGSVAQVEKEVAVEEQLDGIAGESEMILEDKGSVEELLLEAKENSSDKDIQSSFESLMHVFDSKEFQSQKNELLKKGDLYGLKNIYTKVMKELLKGYVKGLDKTISSDQARKPE